MKKLTLLLITAAILTGLCGCSRKPATENYFGGEGDFKASDNIFCFYDDDSIYSNFNDFTLKKYNSKNNTFYIACDDPECEHIYADGICKANTRYCVFNGMLLNVFNEELTQRDGTHFNQGYLNLCNGHGKKAVYKNERPAEFSDPIYDNTINSAFALSDEYLVLDCPGYMYILDADFNVKYTLSGGGCPSGGVYLADNEIYYADTLYRLMKFNKESGEASRVDLDENKVFDCFADGNVLWFSNGNELCSYDFESGEVKVHTKNAFFLKNLGRYIQFADVLEGGREGVYLFDKESGEVRYFADEYQNFYFVNGVYYKFDKKSGTLTLYEDDLTTVIKTAVLEE